MDAKAREDIWRTVVLLLCLNLRCRQVLYGRVSRRYLQRFCSQRTVIAQPVYRYFGGDLFGYRILVFAKEAVA